jgi:hypothetical protein
MCALVYTLWIRSVERRWAVAVGAAAALKAAGQEGVEIPDLDDVLADLDDWLWSDLSTQDPERAALERALGVAEG